MTKANKKGFTLIELIIVIAILAILIVALAPQLIKYIEKSRVKKDTSSLDGVYNTLKAALEDENNYQINTVDNNQVKWVKLADLLDATTSTPVTTGDYAPLAAELFSASDTTGTLDIGYTYKGGEDGCPFKSKTAKDAEVYFAIDGEGKVAVCLSSDGANVLTAFGTDGIVGDVSDGITF